MSISVITPALLWLLLLLPAFWLFAWLTRQVNLVRLGRWRFASLIALRSLILAALVLALAGAQLVRPVDDTAVVFLIDGSDSVSPALREQALDYVNEAIATSDEGDQAAVVIFGADAAVERAPGPATPLRRLSSLVFSERTDIADAIQLGLALLPAEAQKRIVLLSDGGENEGRAAESARLAAVRGVPISVVPLRAVPGPDVLINNFEAPARAREQQTLPLAVTIVSGVAGPALLEIFADDDLVASETVELAIGTNRFTVDVAAGEAGFRRFAARITSESDTEPLNNRAAAFTEVEGPPRILLVTAAPDRAEPLRAALAAAGLRPELIDPALTPVAPADLRQYAAVALVDVPSSAVPNEAQRALVTYVEDQGGGLLMIGGEDSFGAGGWRRSPIAPILPVDLDPPRPDQRPDLALALVIDRSGSMAAEAGDGSGRTKLSLAREAVYQATLGLTQNDQLAVIAFDDIAQTVLPLQPLPDILGIEEALSMVSDGGGTNIRAGIASAAEIIGPADARIKHVILLTDGQDSNNYADLIDQLREAQVTITIVSIGVGANPVLNDLAQRGGGAFYNVERATDVPQIFLEETVRVAQRDIVEGLFTPAVAVPAPPVRDLGALPPLRGYNNSGPRPAARTLLTTAEGAPVLALWQRGLGRTLAWTSDMKGQWAGDWITWEQFPRFAAGLVDAVLPPPAGDRLALESRSEAGEAQIDILVSDDAGVPAAAATIEGRLVGPDGEGRPLTFRAVGAGRYRATTSADSPGVYLVQATALNNDGSAIGAISGGLVVSYSPEYGLRSANEALLIDLATLTGGSVEPAAETLFSPLGQRVGQVREISLPLLWLALVLLPFDIALRRLFLRRSDVAVMLPRRRPATVPDLTPDQRMERLRAARNRAQRPQVERPTQTATVSPAENQPPPKQDEPPPPPPPVPTPADSVASLLASKQRRKR